MLLGEMHSANIVMTKAALMHLPPEYRACDSSCEEEEDERSYSEEETPQVEETPLVEDSSDEEGAHQPWYRPRPSMVGGGQGR
jgi:hypothetical protein